MTRRKLTDYGLNLSRPTLRLSDDDQELLSQWAAQHHTNYSEWIERIVHAWCIEHRALDKVERDPVSGGYIGVNRAIGEQV